MFSKMDIWAGKTLFIPLIIKVCQKAKITQYKFAAYGWAIAVMLLLTRRPEGVTDWIMYAIMVVIGVSFIAVAAVRPDLPRSPSSFMRVMAWFTVLVLVLPRVVMTLTFDYRELYWLLVLFAEYARTIDTIPPEEIKEKATKLVPSKSRTG